MRTAHHWASALSARNVICSGHSGAAENPFESKSFHLKPILLLFNEKVITYMKTVVWQCCVCVQQSSCNICWATGLHCEFLPVSKGFSTRGLITGTAGTWQCQRWGEVGTRETGVVLMREFFHLCTTIQKSLLGGCFRLYDHLKFLAAWSGECGHGRKGKRKGYPQKGLWAVFRLHCPLLDFSPAVWAQPERTHPWPRLSRILSMLGNNVLLVPLLTYHRMRFHSMQVWRTKYLKNSSEKCRRKSLLRMPFIAVGRDEMRYTAVGYTLQNICLHSS